MQLGLLHVKLATWFRDFSDELFFFVHGLGCSKKSWLEAWSRPELRGRSLLALDLPGFGHSERPQGFGGELTDHASLLECLIDAHASKRIHLVAHSMGGSSALLLPDRILSRLERLTLIEPRLLVSSCGVASQTAGEGFDVFRREAFPRFKKAIMRDARSGFDLNNADLESFYAGATSLRSWATSRKLLDRFRHCPCPIVFVYGSINSHLEELKHIDDEQKLSIPDAGHFVMQDQPKALYHYLAS